MTPTTPPAPPLSLSALSIRRHIGTLMLTLAVMVIGIFFIFRLQVDLLPAITYPRLGVRVNAPGVPPEVALEEITKPVEQAMSATEGVVQLFSRTREGRVLVDLYFQPGDNLDRALNDATASLNRVRAALPEDTTEEPQLFKIDPSQSPVYEFALRSPSLQPVELRVFAEEELTRELGYVAGVAAAEVAGGVQEEIRVNVDLKRLQALGLSLSNVLAALQVRNQDVAGGRLRGARGEPVTRTLGRFQSVADIRDLSLSADSGNNATEATASENRVYLRDVAEIVNGTTEQRVFVTLNSQDAIRISILKQPDANTVAVVDAVKTRLEQLRRSGLIPADLEIVSTLDESVFIRKAIANVTNAGISGTVLAALAVLLFLGSLRQTLIIAIAIPLATLTAIILMKLFGLTINIFSLGGLALGVGIVVDNAIVMLENITTSLGRRPEQSQVLQAAEAGGQEVESALLASTTTNLVSVVPFLLLGGFFSLLFGELVLTISFAVAASLLIAVTVVPMLSSRLLGLPYSSGISRWWPLKAFQKLVDVLTRAYGRFLAVLVRWRWLFVPLVFAIVGSYSFSLFQLLPQEILPPINTGQAELFANFPPGTTLATNQRIMAIADEIISQQPEVAYTFSTIGGFLSSNVATENPLRSSSSITLKPGSDLEGFVERVNETLGQLNLVKTDLNVSSAKVRGLNVNNSPARNADIDLVLQSEDEDLLEQAGTQLLAILRERSELARFRSDVESRRPEVRIQPDWERLQALGLTTQTLGQAVQTALAGTVPTQLQRGARLVDVRVQLSERADQGLLALQQLPVFNDSRGAVRVSDVATLSEGLASGQIQRINQRSVFLIIGNLKEGANLSDALAEVDTILSEVQLPVGVTLLPSYAQQTNQELQASLRVIGVLATFLVFVVMAVQYNSLIDPLVILLTVPLAVAGAIWGLYQTETALGATVLIGAVLLVGIAVNNAIVMIDFANQLREKYGLSRRTAIIKAAPQRLRPILMTTITTVLGLLPLAQGVDEGAEFLQPLGIVIFYGLSFATLLTLFLIPCFYVLLHEVLPFERELRSPEDDF